MMKVLETKIGNSKPKKITAPFMIIMSSTKVNVFKGYQWNNTMKALNQKIQKMKLNKKSGYEI